MRLRSLLDLDLPPLVDAERLLAELRDQRTWRLIGAAGLMAVAVLAVVALPQVSLVPAAGALAALGMAGIAFGRRRSLLEALLQVRDAYRLEEVSRAGSRFATRERRTRLARWVRDIIGAAEGRDVRVAYTAAALDERVLARKERLLRVAAALDGGDEELHPAGVAIVHRLLTRPSVSPLFNPLLEEQILDDALHRVEACTGDSPHAGTVPTIV
jgi:hypothetical protein